MYEVTLRLSNGSTFDFKTMLSNISVGGLLIAKTSRRFVIGEVTSRPKEVIKSSKTAWAIAHFNPENYNATIDVLNRIENNRNEVSNKLESILKNISRMEILNLLAKEDKEVNKVLVEYNSTLS